MGELEFGRVHVHPVLLPESGVIGLADNHGNRCSGIHRGMGTHISRVKSVDLDTWTDEQLASMLRWGNARANKSVVLPYCYGTMY